MVETLEAQARAQEAQGNQVGLLETLSTLATVLRELDEGRARSALEQAYRVALTIQDQQGMAPSLRQLGFLYHLQGGWDRALELYHRALALQREAGDQTWVAMILGNVAEAREVLEQGLALYEMVGDAMGRAATINTLGFVQRRLGDLEGAYQRYAGAKDLLQGLGDVLRVTILIHNMALIHEERGEYREALR